MFSLYLDPKSFYNFVWLNSVLNEQALNKFSELILAKAHRID